MFIVIEGPDGTGKTEQTKRLVAHLRAASHEVEDISFPRYETPTGKKVKEYLEGKLGSIEEIGAKKASALYADDRKAAAEDIRKWLLAGKMVVANRYVASNMAHQGAKIAHPEDRAAFFEWNNELEYKQNEIPVPSINIVLGLPYEVAAGRIDRRGNAKDMHELDENHLRRANDVYREIAKKFPTKFTIVECMDGKRELLPNEVHELIWQVISHGLR